MRPCRKWLVCRPRKGTVKYRPGFSQGTGGGIRLIYATNLVMRPVLFHRLDSTCPFSPTAQRCRSSLSRNVLSLVRKNRNPSGGLYRCRRRSAHDWRRTNVRRFLMKALMLRPAPRLMHAFRQNPLGLSDYTAFFVSSAKPGLGHLGVIPAAYIGLMDLLARAQSYFSNLLLRSNPSSPQSALRRSRYFTHT
jgi:hypothetical protein